MKTLLNGVSVAVLALALTACATTPPPSVKPDEMPKAFTAPAIAPPAQPGVATADTQQAVAQQVAAEWWKSFASPELAGFVEEAHTGNLDIAAAAGRVMQARGQTGVAWSSLFPTAGVSGTASRQESQGFFGGTQTTNSFSLAGAASYELDFWGLAQNNIRAARNNARAAIYAQRIVTLTTEADVANTYFTVLALRQRVDIARKNIEAAKRILAITQAKVENGVLSNLELAQQTAQVRSQEALVPRLEEQEREARYALAILLGKMPEGFDVKGASLDGLQTPRVDPGIPATLLTRRPDVAQAEAGMLAAHANLDAARAAFLPGITLNADGGWQGNDIANLVNPSNLVWSIGARVLQTIFDGGRLTSQRDIAEGRQVELVAAYRSAVLNALADTESQIGGLTSFTEQERLTTDQVANAMEAFRISELQYREGVIDLLTVLQAQQTLFSSQDQLIQIKLARLQSGVGLYRALGGGWSIASDEDTSTRNPFVPIPDFLDLPIGLPF